MLNSSNAWHIQPEAAMRFLPEIVNLLKGISQPIIIENHEELGKLNFELFVQKYSAIGAEPFLTDRENWAYDFVPLKMGDVLMIPVMDVISQYDYWGVAGTSTIANWYDRAEKDASIKAVIEIKNTPGGQVFGTRALAERKIAFGNPIIGLTTGLQCSAGALIGAADNYAMAETADCIIGSIGVMTTIVNALKYYADQGIDILEIYSKTSPLKNDAHRKAMKGDLKGYEEGILFKFDQSFMGFMQEHRPNISKTALAGAEFMSQEAIENGLIDEIGNFQAAYDIALQAIDNSKFLTYKKSTKTMATKVVKLSSLVAKIADALGVETITIEDDVTAPEGEASNSIEESEVSEAETTETPFEASAIAEVLTLSTEGLAFETRLKKIEGAYETSLTENAELKASNSTLQGTIANLEGTVNTLKGAIKKPVVANPKQEASDATALTAQNNDDGFTHYNG